MLQKIKKFFLIIITSIIIFSCQGAQDAIQGKKRSVSNDEFLVEKKNPLMMPPDYEDLPVPVEKETEESNVNQNDSELIKLLESQNEKTSNDSDKNLTLEKSIIEKISK
tara:strand:+ start:454 stop:780 length:327 start_codon:yes stop_codon:yes gene_type:complete